MDKFMMTKHRQMTLLWRGRCCFYHLDNYGQIADHHMNELFLRVVLEDSGCSFEETAVVVGSDADQVNGFK